MDYCESWISCFQALWQGGHFNPVLLYELEYSVGTHRTVSFVIANAIFDYMIVAMLCKTGSLKFGGQPMRLNRCSTFIYKVMYKHEYVQLFFQITFVFYLNDVNITEIDK